MTVRRAIGAGVAAAAFAVLLVRGADHGDAPGVRINSRLDINDVYAFQAPGNAGHTVLIMTVSPLAGITGATTFHPQGKYLLKVDTNGDAVEDTTFRITFSNPDDNGVQRVRLKEIADATMTTRTATAGSRRPASPGQNIAVGAGGTLRAGRFDDPFFFDLLAFQERARVLPWRGRHELLPRAGHARDRPRAAEHAFRNQPDRCLGAHVAGRQDDRSDGTSGDQHRLHPE